MSRKPPTESPPEVKNRKNPEFINQTRHYKLITPLYGGGVAKAEADPITVIRGTEVRGHLRFWWRATRGANYRSLQDMRVHEESIWGSSAAPSRPGPSSVLIRINTDTTKRGNLFQAVNSRGQSINNIGDPSSIDGYVAFPLRELHNPGLLSDIEFDLQICYPEKFKNEIEAALWAWETFGGIGARTRRGFGALQSIQIDGKDVTPPQKQEIWQNIVDGLEKYVSAGESWPKGMPHLSHNMKFIVISDSNSSKAIDVWRYMVSKYKDFRQSRQGRFGRSEWPEPDQIRRVTDTHAPGRNPEHPVGKFPRAKFGLPIIFEFKKTDVNVRDPQKTTLQGIEDNKHIYDRLASPLVLRPLACSDRPIGLAAILEWQPLNPDDETYTPPGGLILKGAHNAPKVYSDIDKAEAQNIPPLNGEPDVLQAFLNFIQS